MERFSVLVTFWPTQAAEWDDVLATGVAMHVHGMPQDLARELMEVLLEYGLELYDGTIISAALRDYATQDAPARPMGEGEPQ